MLPMSWALLAQWRITYRTYVTRPRARPGRGAMWRSGAPQRRAARGAPRGADAHTCCYVMSRRGTRQLKAYSLDVVNLLQLHLNRSPFFSKIILVLNAKPEIGGIAEEAGKAECSINRDLAVALQNLRDTSCGDVSLLGESIGRDVERLQKLLKKYLPGVILGIFAIEVPPNDSQQSPH